MSLFGFTGFGTITPDYLSGDPLTGGYGVGVIASGLGLSNFIRNLLNSAWLIAGLGAFIYMVMGGFRYLTAAGDAKAAAEASKQITGAITGLALIIGSYALARVVGAVMGVDIFNPSFQGP